MIIEKHSLAIDYPEYKDRIHDLKVSNAHFSKRFDEYNDVDREIIRIEEGIENTSDEYIDSLKMKRIQLKDELVAMLKS